MHAVFPALLILLGAALAAWTWHAGGLPRTAFDRVLDHVVTDEQRVALDITLSFAVMALGVVAA
jgi:hypothetical protein